jgi:catechol 1,2-dioxygenase
LKINKYKKLKKRRRNIMKNQKVIDVYNGLVVKFKELVSEYEIDHNDYQALVDWMDQLGRAGEIPLFMDVFFETHALQV